jgi:putative nucleotidyltransferase with HDIG domain
VTAAFAAQFVAQDLGLDGGILFTAGILHDIGKIALAHSRGWTDARLEAGRVDPHTKLLLWEKVKLGFTHAEIGARILEKWNFSDQLSTCVRFHHDPTAGGEFSRLAACVGLADMLAHYLNDPTPEQRVATVQTQEALEILGLGEERLAFYDDRIRENIQFVESMCHS